MSAELPTRLTSRFGCRHPFASAGMAFAGEKPELAIAVTNAGGIGAIGVGFMPPEPLRAVIQAIRDAADGPFNINFITCFDNDAQVKVCAEERVPIVSFHWGHPSADHLAVLQDAGTSVWEQVGTVDDARRAVADGVEVVIAQGWEAGGHNYGGCPRSSTSRRCATRSATTLLLLASGGIADGRGVAAALALGADGVWVGTRLLASREANVHPEHQRRLRRRNGLRHGPLSGLRARDAGLQPDAAPPQRCRRRVDRAPRRGPDGAQRPARDRPHGVPRPALHQAEVRRPPAGPETEGDWEEMPWLMGQGVGLVDRVQPAAEIVEEMIADAAATLSRIAP